MKTIKEEIFRQKVEIIVTALLSHDITKEHAIKCLSSVVVVPSDVDTAMAVEQVEKILTRHRNNSGIDLRELTKIGVSINADVTLPPLKEELEFELAFGTESLPFMTDDVAERWSRIAFGYSTDVAPPIHLGVHTVEEGPPPPSDR